MLRAHADDYYEQTGREQLSLTGITHCLATATKCVFYPPPSPPPYSPLSCEEQRELLSLTDATEAHGITDCDAVHLHKADVAAACSGPSNEVECEELCARYYVYAPGSVQVCRGRRYQSDGSDRILYMNSDNDVQFDEEFYKYLCNTYGAQLREKVFFFVDNRNVIGEQGLVHTLVQGLVHILVQPCMGHACSFAISTHIRTTRLRRELQPRVFHE